MKIKGFQEFTLVDYPGNIACTIFLHGCNFRCGFCYNPELVLSELADEYSKKEIFDFLEKRRGQLEGVCITGGEPLMTVDVEFLKRIKDMGYQIKIDTNGSFPDLLEELIKDCLVDCVAMDIKTTPEKYSQLTNCEIDMKKIEKSIWVVSGLEYYEFRTTILEDEHGLEDAERIGKWINDLIGKKGKKISLQGFKNVGKFIDEKYKDKKNTREEYLKELKSVLENYFEFVEIRF